jgi:hypothetical protein
MENGVKTIFLHVRNQLIFSPFHERKGGYAMKKYGVIIIAFILALLPFVSEASTIGTLRISFLQGDVQIKSEKAEQWMSAVINMPLMEGDSITVPEAGRLEIQFYDGSLLRLDEYSSFIIQTKNTSSYQFYLEEGHAYINFIGEDKVIEVETPVSLFRAYDRSRFRIDLPDYGNSAISVFKGVVYAENRDETLKVHAGDTLTISDDRYAGITPLGRSDEWERWNSMRDREFEEQVYSSRHLPDELRAYSSDFDRHGKWVYVGDYGYVWTPIHIVQKRYKRWSPYRYGKWRWIGNDYVWISPEPWGWAPYHYGRWAFRVSIGWFWVPPVRGKVYWGPGYVGWIYAPTYVAWVPLAPGDTYYGYGYYGPRSVNIFKLRINKRYTKNIYRNAYVKNSVTIIYKDSFVKGRYVPYRAKRNPFLKKRLYIGRPKIKPKREHLYTKFKKIRHSQNPQQVIRKLRIRDQEKKSKIVNKYSRSKQRIIEKQNRRFQKIRNDERSRIIGKPKYSAKGQEKSVKPKTRRYKQSFETDRKNRANKKSVLKERSRRSQDERYAKTRRQIRQQNPVRIDKRKRTPSENGIGIQEEKRAFRKDKKWTQNKRRFKRAEDNNKIVRSDRKRKNRHR